MLKPKMSALRIALTDRDRRTVLGLILLLALILFAGIWVTSSLNLDYSQRTLSEVRSEQIDDLFRSGWERVEYKQRKLEHYTLTIARLGESYYRLRENNDLSASVYAELGSELEFAVAEQVRTFEGVAGVGVWFEPGTLSAVEQKRIIRYQVLSDALRLVPMPADTDYRDTDWFSRIVEQNSSGSDSAQVQWTAVYFDLEFERAQFTLAAPMFDSSGRLIGRVTTDWSADQVVELVDATRVTEGSFSFLIDSNNRNLSSLSKDAQSQTSQRLVDAVLALNLPDLDSSPEKSAQDRIKQDLLWVDERAYELFYRETGSGLIFGMGVPSDEVDAVLLPLRQSNLTILAFMALVLMVLTLLIFRRIYHLMLALKAAHIDEVTGLPNRLELFERVKLDRDTGLVLINIDRFKEINALFGQVCGDKVLREVANRLVRELQVHTESDANQVYRMPGDEFLLRLDAKSSRYVEVVARSLLTEISGLKIQWLDQILRVELSAGISLAIGEKDQPGLEKLISQASLALDTGRSRGVRICSYDPSQSREAVYEQNIYWAGQLRKALAADQILPFFQPIHSNVQGEITKYECLIRMVDDAGETVSPAHFLGIAHKLKLDRQLTGLMIDKCFTKFRDSHFEFSINLTYSDISDPTTLERILKWLSQTEIGSRVIFEILESDGIENYDQMMAFIEQVRPFGARIAIDDFGTGYSNFEHLLRLKIDLIKIDGSLIKAIDTDENAYRVTEGLVQFAQRLNIETVAEFVHNEAVQKRVAALGVDYSQGYHFGEPAADLVGQN